MLDLFLLYQFIRRLATPFNKWKAYDLGIIDERGEILKPRKSLKTVKERDAFGLFDVLILNIKKLIEKAPGGKSRLASYAAALYLIKEHNMFNKNKTLLNEQIININYHLLQQYVEYTVNEKFVNTKIEESLEMLKEEITMSAGSGQVAGIGIGPDGEPGVTPEKQKEYKKKNRKSYKKFVKELEVD